VSWHLAERLDAFVDGELLPSEVRDVEAHLAECDICRRRVESRRALSSALRASLPRYPAPASLRRAPSAPAPASPLASGFPSTSRRWFAAAAAAVVIGVAGLGGYGLGVRQGTAGVTRDAVVASHIRSLLANHLTDVASSDRHTVKPWFTGVLDFAPTVVDPAADGFPLVGGRVDYIDGRRVAALVYGRNKHVINLFEWPTARADAPIAASVDNGYNVLHWVSGRIEYWMISDLNAAELRQCAALVHE
jgi:anti-sigma factor RsiW